MFITDERRAFRTSQRNVQRESIMTCNGMPKLEAALFPLKFLLRTPSTISHYWRTLPALVNIPSVRITSHKHHNHENYWFYRELSHYR